MEISKRVYDVTFRTGICNGSRNGPSGGLLRTIFTNSNSKASSLVDHYTYVLASDGDLQEPVALGTASLAGHLGLSLIVFYDANKAQISGNTNRSDSTNYKKYLMVLIGMCKRSMATTIIKLNNQLKMLRKIIAPHYYWEYHYGKRDCYMEGDHNTHGAPLSQEEIDLSKFKLGLPNDKFYFPEKIKMYYQARFSKLSAVLSCETIKKHNYYHK